MKYEPPDPALVVLAIVLVFLLAFLAALVEAAG